LIGLDASLPNNIIAYTPRLANMMIKWKNKGIITLAQVEGFRRNDTRFQPIDIF